VVLVKYWLVCRAMTVVRSVPVGFTQHLAPGEQQHNGLLVTVGMLGADIRLMCAVRDGGL
jgi:hypothetical protein